MKVPFEEKFIPVPETGCWLWVSGLDRHGYGKMTGNAAAHREAYERYVGPIPSGMCVCHKCDTRSCVNPNHLFLGTHKQNAHDRRAKGRSAAGQRSPHAKLSDAAILDILTSGQSKTALAERYGVSRGLIGHIRGRRAWLSTVDRISAEAGVFVPRERAA